MRSPTTAKDAVIVEMVDEITKLSDQIQQLPDTLRENVDPAAQRIEQAAIALKLGVEQLVKAGNDHQARISEYVDKVAVPQINDTAVQAIRQVEQAARALAQAQTAQTPPRFPEKASRRDVATTIVMGLVCMASGVALGWLLFHA